MSWRVCFVNFGCRSNYADTERLAGVIFERVPGCITRISRPGEACAAMSDVVVINSCCVTSAAEKECAYFIRRLARRSAKPLIIVMGCYAARAGAAIADMPGVDAVFASRDEAEPVKWLASRLAISKPKPAAAGIDGAEGAARAAGAPKLCAGRHHRAFIKIQDGCDDYCSFCVVPFVRGRARSVPISEIQSQCAYHGARGVREIVLTGVNMGRYGADIEGSEGLGDVFAVVGAMAGIERVRLSSIDPADITPALLSAAAAAPTILPSFHIPIQSGSDAILKRMRRRYRAADVADRLALILARFPDAAIGCDVMVGFPGESDEDFDATCALLREAPVCKFHVFAYSPRPGTAAERMADGVPRRVVQERARALKTLGEYKLRAALEAHIGRPTRVLVEEKRRGHWWGYTRNYLPICGPWRAGLALNAIIDAVPAEIENVRWHTYACALRV